MGDFVLDFRPPEQRGSHGEALRFFPDQGLGQLDDPAFRLTVTWVGDGALWAPYRAPDGSFVALAGRPALDAAEWARGDAVQGDGGLACKAIHAMFREGGPEALTGLSGAFAAHVFDARARRYHLVLDPAGVYPCFVPAGDGTPALLGSHADVVARALGQESEWDAVSLAQFVATGVVSHPHTYYTGVRGLGFGQVLTFGLEGGEVRAHAAVEFAPREFTLDPGCSEDDLADRLAAAIRAGTQRCTSPRLGRTVLALSGGLDSRTLISSADRHADLVAACAFDEENEEFRVASRIAAALDVPMIPLQRPFDHYADHAELGVRIAGGMGSLSSNHFLGFRDRLRELGCDNLVTGCYFDYLFKSLAIDTRESRVLRREVTVPFRMRSYLPVFPAAQGQRAALEQRLQDLYPQALRDSDAEADRLRVAALRTFPLWREGDNIQRLIGARCIGWFAPATLREVLDVYWATPLRPRIGKSMFRKTVLRAIDAALRPIPDNNTGLRVDAPSWLVGLQRYRIALRRKLERRSESLATAESWPNWAYYLRHSARIQELWSRPHARARALIEELTGERFAEDAQVYVARSEDLFVRLLTVKLWAEQRG